MHVWMPNWKDCSSTLPITSLAIDHGPPIRRSSPLRPLSFHLDGRRHPKADARVPAAADRRPPGRTGGGGSTHVWSMHELVVSSEQLLHGCVQNLCASASVFSTNIQNL